MISRPEVWIYINIWYLRGRGNKSNITIRSSGWRADNKRGGERPTHFIHLFMFQFSPTSSTHSPRHRPQPRDDSLHQHGELAGLHDELKDFKRVHDQGQEEDLKLALSRTITKVEELVRCRMLNRPSSLVRSLLTQKNQSALTVYLSDRALQSSHRAPNGADIVQVQSHNGPSK